MKGHHFPVLLPPGSGPGMQLLVNIPPPPPVMPLQYFPNYPQQQFTPSFANILSSFPNVFAKQTTKGCCQECLGCEAQTEFQFATLQDPHNNIMYALEESECCVRAICPRMRPWVMNMSWGPTSGGQALFRFIRPFRLDSACCKCCCHQEVSIYSHITSKELGIVKEDFYLCVPTFKVYLVKCT